MRQALNRLTSEIGGVACYKQGPSYIYELIGFKNSNRKSSLLNEPNKRYSCILTICELFKTFPLIFTYYDNYNLTTGNQ